MDGENPQYVRSWLKADIGGPSGNVRYTPKSGHSPSDLEPREKPPDSRNRPLGCPGIGWGRFALLATPCALRHGLCHAAQSVAHLRVGDAVVCAHQLQGLAPEHHVIR